mgnify:CR=1 FL=1
MSRIILLTGILWLFSQSIHAEQSQITSPDGKLSVHITDENGVPSTAFLIIISHLSCFPARAGYKYR